MRRASARRPSLAVAPTSNVNESGSSGTYAIQTPPAWTWAEYPDAPSPADGELDRLAARTVDPSEYERGIRSRDRSPRGRILDRDREVVLSGRVGGGEPKARGQCENPEDVAMGHDGESSGTNRHLPDAVWTPWGSTRRTAVRDEVWAGCCRWSCLSW